MFGEFPNVSEVASDKVFVSNWNEQFKDEFISQEDIYRSLALKELSNVELVKGDIAETLPKYLKKHGEMRISLLHIDTDVYEPCKIGLQCLYDLVVPYGIVVFDDYSTIEGETKAVDEFFADKTVRFHKFSLSHEKPVYIVKGKID